MENYQHLSKQLNWNSHCADKLTIHWTAEQIHETVTDFVSVSEDSAREKYALRRDTQDWKVHLAQADLRNHPDANQYIKRFTTVHLTHVGPTILDNPRGFHCAPRPATMRHLLKENLALCTHRSLRVLRHGSIHLLPTELPMAIVFQIQMVQPMYSRFICIQIQRN